MPDEQASRDGALFEQLGSRFELVLEAVTGFGGRLDSLREELRGQFTEIGRQIRFLSEQIAINRSNAASVKQDLSAEIVRLGEELGKSRIETTDRLNAAENRLRSEIAAARAALESETAAIRERLDHEAAPGSGRLRAANDSGAALAKKLEGELKRAAKMLAALDRKFDRFDDRVTIQTRDQEQRVRKLERQSRG